MRYELTDFEWSIIQPVLPTKSRGVPRMDDRRVLNGIFWVLRSGAPWRDLPECCGPYTTCYNRFSRWRRAGIWDNILTAMTDRAYDTDAIRELARERGAWANIPPKRNRRNPICYSPHLYRDRNHVERSSTGSSIAGASQPVTTSWRRTSWPSSSSRPSAYGWAFMSPRPSRRRG